tara:strand:+ start:155 stop:379 length:225 start_codon:yes stop_codon:yes gene_type:complete
MTISNSKRTKADAEKDLAKIENKLTWQTERRRNTLKHVGEMRKWLMETAPPTKWDWLKMRTEIVARLDEVIKRS